MDDSNRYFETRQFRSMIDLLALDQNRVRMFFYDVINQLLFSSVSTNCVAG